MKKTEKLSRDRENKRKRQDLAGKRILITSGPTRGYLDAVRYISNTSTGKLGASIAVEALSRGAFVTFVYGTGSMAPDIPRLGKGISRKLTLIEVEIIDDLLTVILDRLRASSFDAVIHAMAVLDYMPGRLSKGKIPSNKDKLTLTLTKTPKIIGIMREVWPETFFVSFKLEAGLSVDELIKRAYTSLKKNDVNLVVANDQNEIAGGKHRAYLIDSQKNVVSVCETKRDIAHNLMDVVSGHLRNLANKRQIKST